MFAHRIVCVYLLVANIASVCLWRLSNGALLETAYSFIQVQCLSDSSLTRQGEHGDVCVYVIPCLLGGAVSHAEMVASGLKVLL